MCEIFVVTIAEQEEVLRFLERRGPVENVGVISTVQVGLRHNDRSMTVLGCRRESNIVGAATVTRMPEDHTAHDELLRTSGVYADIYQRQLRPASVSETEQLERGT